MGNNGADAENGETVCELKEYTVRVCFFLLSLNKQIHDVVI